MKKITVAFRSNEYSDAPEKLKCVASLDDVQKIRELHKNLMQFREDIWSVNLNISLYDTPQKSDWRYDANYLIMYLYEYDTGDIKLYQYFQSKYDATDQIESEQISLNELEEYLKSKEQ